MAASSGVAAERGDRATEKEASGRKAEITRSRGTRVETGRGGERRGIDIGDIFPLACAHRRPLIKSLLNRITGLPLAYGTRRRNF